MENRITAQEAYENASGYWMNKNTLALKMIYSNIKEQSEKGCFETTITFDSNSTKFREAIRETLMNNGYNAHWETTIHLRVNWEKPC